MWLPSSHAAPLVAMSAVALAAALAGCGSGDSTVAKTPQATKPPTTVPSTSDPQSSVAAPPPSSTPPPDPCAVNLASPTIAKVVSELPRDPRSQQPWDPEPLAGNYNECAQLSAVIIRANTNGGNPTTRAVLFHLGKFIPQGVPDTYGFTGIDPAQSTGDTVALTSSNAVGLNSMVRFRWNGSGVELIGNSRG